MQWYEQFRAAFGPHPENYLCFDCETTGLSTERDLPIQIGHCLVRDRQVVHRGSYYLNWLKHPGVSREWLTRRLDNVAASFERSGKPFHITLGTLLTEGEDPTTALNYYLNLFRANEASGAVLMGHNIIRFDWPLLFNTFHEFLSEVWEVKASTLWDTGVLEKARQLSSPVQPKEEFLQYQKRAAKAFGLGRVRWSLAHCVEDYGLAERHQLDANQLHDAEYDSYVTHLLCEAQREVFEKGTEPNGGNHQQGTDVPALVSGSAG